MKPLYHILTVLLALGLTGCVVGDEEYETARRQRDEYRGQLQELYQTNDKLNKDIALAYAECEALSSKLALVAASDAQREYATDLLPPPSRQRTRPRGSN
ncbi:hypothetical protein C4J81_08185 [Deltaproteobacteria bacterium Smac51]|nr:hypothetical protein C4J81_08185 [Deltaproteobacteria bacterium Smac51]